MALMISLDDAMEVLIRGGFLDEEWQEEDGGYEYIRSELEQKCYIVMKRKSEKWTDLVIDEIDEVMNAESIASHIADGTLHNWLECHKDIAMAQLELLAEQLT